MAMHDVTPPLPPAYQPKTKKPWWILWVLLALFVLLMAGCSVLSFVASAFSGAAISAPQNNAYIEDVFHKDDGYTERLAVVSVKGMITGQSKSSFQPSMTDVAIAKIKRATKDESIKGLLLYLNTPGGEVTASDKIYHAAKQFSETGRPVVAYMDTVAASGGYYIACAADEVVANETSITGSIGVIINGINATEMLDKIGVKSQTFKSGDFKDTMSFSREMREDERAYIQDLVNDMYEKFAGIVSEARDIPMETLKDGIADGRIFQGSAAKEVGLVDETGYVEDGIARLKKLAKIEKAVVIRYTTKPNITDFIGILGMQAQEETTIQVDWGQGQFTQEMKPFVPYSVLPGY